MSWLGPPLLDQRSLSVPVAALERAFAIGRWCSGERVPGGKNEHFRIQTDRGEWYVRRSYRTKRREELLAQLALQREVRRRGLPAPVPAPTHDGSGVAVVDGRLYSASARVSGTPYAPNNAAHVATAGHTLATYHRLVEALPADLAAPHIPARPSLLDELTRRVDRIGGAGEAGDATLADTGLLDPGLVDIGRALLAELTPLWPQLPTCVVHGGWRRGSLLFDGDDIVGVLDFDSARIDARCLDLATAVHDFGKVYGEVGAADHKVPLDLDRVAALLSAYVDEIHLDDAEVAALPLLLEATRLKRALGRSARLVAGEPLSPNDVRKIRLERARLAWLDEHRGALMDVCRSAGRVAGP